MKKSTKWLIGILIGLIVIAGGLFLWQKLKPETASNQTDILSNISSENNLPDNTVLIYADTIKNENGVNDRGYPIENIMRKVGTNKSELIATVGDAKSLEEVEQYTLGSDKNTLYVNLETKIIKIDLQTKEKNDVVKADKSIGSFILSQDGSQMLIWDQALVNNNDKNYEIRQIDLKTGAVKTIKTGTMENPYFLRGWRSDNKIILAEGLGEGENLWMLDSQSLVFTQINKNGMTMADISPSGTVLEALFVNDACDDFGGGSIGAHTLIDSLNGNALASIKEDGKQISFIAFAPNDKQILFVREPIRTVRQNCDNDTRTLEYFIYDVDKKTSEKIDMYTTLQQWNEPNYGIGAKVKRGSDGRSNIISYQDKDIIKTNGNQTGIGELKIIASYFK